MARFRVTKGTDEAGNDWLICFGADPDGAEWYITTDRASASQLHRFSGGARADAELVCRLLNEHYKDSAQGVLAAGKAL